MYYRKNKIKNIFTSLFFLATFFIYTKNLHLKRSLSNKVTKLFSGDITKIIPLKSTINIRDIYLLTLKLTMSILELKDSGIFNSTIYPIFKLIGTRIKTYN